MRRFLWTALLVLCASACSEDPKPPPTDMPDAGELPDGGLPDGGLPDAGTDGGTTPTSSHGSGKVPCESTGTVANATTTYTYCVTTVAGSQLKIIEPQDTTPGQPLRLAIYLHGDGARTHDNNTAPRIQAPWTFTHRTLYVSARAPNKCAWWTKPTITTCVDDSGPEARDLEGLNAEVFVQVLNALRGGWDLLDEPILFGGSSGGAVFLTASFLPKYGHQYRGVYALGCGGEASWSGKLDWDSTQPALRGPTKLVYTYGDLDPYLADIQGSVSFFGARFFPVEETIVPNAAHCQFDHVGRVTEVWGQATGN
ncbi:hypothetical protein [Hyalangium gracile]|uniref:hypothetical protein n=1 Tax=Hyalangium gracile TaxID=394092 RepID=UPI001CCA3D3D|nr:hypothetical protein [Hyalangium gracile]